MIIILILASLGILDSGYLTYVHMFGGQACGEWSGCSFVLSSQYSRILGIPISAFGLSVYLCLVLLALRARDTRKKVDAALWIFYISSPGVLFAGYLIYLQAAVIQHWCPFCLLSAALISGIFGLSLWSRIAEGNLEFLLRCPNWKFGVKYMLSLLVLPSLVFLGLERILEVFSTSTIMMEQAAGIISAKPINLSDHKVIARMGERKITLENVDDAIRVRLNEIEWIRYNSRLNWLENELFTMEADRQNITVEQLIKKNIEEAITVTDEEIQNVYDANKKQLGNVPFEKMKGQLETLMKKEKAKLKRDKYLAQLKQQNEAIFSIPVPSPLSIDDNPRKGPVIGPDNAAITVIMFTDFECPFCNKAHQQIKEMLKRYPRDIRVVFRNFPLQVHKNARSAAYAAAYAHQQGKFWEYADLLFENQKELGEEKLYEYAEKIGLDMDVFKKDMESGSGKGFVDADMEEGKKLGIRTTPGFFFNGQFVKGVPKPKQIQLILDMYLPKSGKEG